MKVLAINGSARKDGNTAILIKKVLTQLEKEGIETELIQLSGNVIRGCTACDMCTRNMDGRCVVEGDIIKKIIEQMAEADGIILGSPVYFSNMTPELKAVIDRAGRVARANNGILNRKIGAAVVAVRRAGALTTLNAINQFFLVENMMVVGSSYWNLGIGRNIGEVEDDDEGMRTMEDLGKNMAWLLKKVNA